MKTPEEIKKGLECCQTIVRCSICPYHDIGDIVAECTAQLCGDALEHIQQLEHRLAQAERERDAAVADLYLTFSQVPVLNIDCYFCKHKDRVTCDECSWQWRGVCEGENI